MEVTTLSGPSCSSQNSHRQVLHVWVGVGIPAALAKLFNNSTRFQFAQTQQKSAADIAIFDWRSPDDSNNLSSQAKAEQIAGEDELPILIVADDSNVLFSILESPSSLEFSRLEFVQENEIGSAFFDARILKLLATDRQLSVQERLTDHSQTILATVMKHSNDWMVVKSLDHRFMHVSKKFCHAHNLPPESIVGKNDLEIGTSPELVLGKPGTDWRGFWALDEEVTNTGKHVVLQPVVLEEDDLRETRETTDKVPLRDRDGNVFAMFSLCFQVTSREIDLALE